jgi:hypothetical protein
MAPQHPLMVLAKQQQAERDKAVQQHISEINILDMPNENVRGNLLVPTQAQQHQMTGNSAVISVNPMSRDSLSPSAVSYSSASSSEDGQKRQHRQLTSTARPSLLIDTSRPNSTSFENNPEVSSASSEETENGTLNPPSGRVGREDVKGSTVSLGGKSLGASSVSTEDQGLVMKTTSGSVYHPPGVVGQLHDNAQDVSAETPSDTSVETKPTTSTPSTPTTETKEPAATATTATSGGGIKSFFTSMWGGNNNKDKQASPAAQASPAEPSTPSISVTSAPMQPESTTSPEIVASKEPADNVRGTDLAPSSPPPVLYGGFVVYLPKSPNSPNQAPLRSNFELQNPTEPPKAAPADKADSTPSAINTLTESAAISISVPNPSPTANIYGENQTVALKQVSPAPSTPMIRTKLGHNWSRRPSVHHSSSGVSLNSLANDTSKTPSEVNSSPAVGTDVDVNGYQSGEPRRDMQKRYRFLSRDSVYLSD